MAAFTLRSGESHPMIPGREQERWPYAALSLYPEGPTILFRRSSLGPCERAIVPPAGTNSRTAETVGSVQLSVVGRDVTIYFVGELSQQLKRFKQKWTRLRR